MSWNARALLHQDAARLFADRYARDRDLVRLAVVNETFRYNVAFRYASNATTPTTKLLARLWLRRQRLRLGIAIPAGAKIGGGLLIGHAGGIVVSSQAVIGKNCNLGHGVTIGVGRGRNEGAPTIGDRVYIGPGAIIIGGVTIGDDVAIGANAVVTKDVPAGSTVVGNPGQIIEGRGSGDYIHNPHVLEAIDDDFDWRNDWRNRTRPTAGVGPA